MTLGPCFLPALGAVYARKRLVTNVVIKNAVSVEDVLLYSLLSHATCSYSSPGLIHFFGLSNVLSVFFFPDFSTHVDVPCL